MRRRNQTSAACQSAYVPSLDLIRSPEEAPDRRPAQRVTTGVRPPCHAAAHRKGAEGVRQPLSDFRSQISNLAVCSDPHPTSPAREGYCSAEGKAMRRRGESVRGACDRMVSEAGFDGAGSTPWHSPTPLARSDYGTRRALMACPERTAWRARSAWMTGRRWVTAARTVSQTSGTSSRKRKQRSRSSAVNWALPMI